MFVDRVEVSFDAGHRILGHSGKCAAPHGHTYRVEAFIQSDGLDALGFALDFGDLKGPLKTWIDQNWDHAFLLNSADAVLLAALRSVPEAKLFVFESANPSAETLARGLYEVAISKLQVPLARIRVWESPNQYSEYDPTPIHAFNGQRVMAHQQSQREN
jgi:6-pyruvoyltetrahydropterin/6-carboxytetrahydropterin synthase